MLSRLKEAYYRREHGPERAALVVRMERELATLEPSEAWVEWFWRLPPEAWKEALAFGRRSLKIVELREEAVRKIVRRNRLREREPDSDEAQEAEAALTRFKSEVVREEERLGEERSRFTAKYGAIPILRASLPLVNEY